MEPGLNSWPFCTVLGLVASSVPVSLVWDCKYDLETGHYLSPGGGGGGGFGVKQGEI